ncbi:MAG TPA: glycosyltransferase family 4 protein [Pseudomonadales bacterium]|nr:glycosyltransferase family 4 protein [Pseudomonadales bacterium]
MKLLVFAHVPPPYHGQSAAVKQMLEHYGGNRRKSKFRREPVNRYGIECYHVNARFSKNLEDVGELQLGKILLVLFFCAQALWCRFRYGVENFYYVPAPGKPIALYRDWLVMLLCRPFFKRLIFHWHASGLARWLETNTGGQVRCFTYNRMKAADASIVLSDFSRRDAEKFLPQHLIVVSGGISDPCPGFESEIMPRRRERLARRKKILSGNFQAQNEADNTINVLFLAHCTREKGVFDSIEGVRLANKIQEADGSPLRFRITLIGAFASDAEEKEIREFVRRDNTVIILGFVSNERKNQELLNADILCFPTYYRAEGQPASLLEAFAFGLPVITTRWRAIPLMLPEDYPGFVSPESPAQIAEKLRLMCVGDFSRTLREIFERRFTLEQHLANMARAIRSVENS